MVRAPKKTFPQMAYLVEVTPKSMQPFFKATRAFLCFHLHFVPLLCLCCFGLCFASHAQENGSTPFVLSKRVGLEIDSIEAEYFNLFPDLDGVKSAVYRKDNFDNLRMLISLANGQDTSITFSKLATEELTKLIDFQEVLADKPELVNWGLLPGYSLDKLNYFEDHGATVFIYKTDTTIVAGKLLMVNDSMIHIWTSGQPFQPHAFPENVVRVRVKEITKIERKQDLTGRIFGITLGAGLGIALFNIGYGAFGTDNLSWENTLYLVAGGAIVGGALGYVYDKMTLSRRKYKIQGEPANYLKIKPKLDKRVMFTKIYPPELY